MRLPGVQGIVLAVAMMPAAGLAQQPAAQPVSEPQAGETVRLQVNFQSCRRTRGTGNLLCTFYGGGVKYYATKDTDTHVATFRRLQDSAPGTPMVAEGRIAQAFGGTAEIHLDMVSGRVAGPLDRVLQSLQGKWVSESDRNDEFTITGSERRGYYAGLSTLTESISVQDSCGSASGRPPYMYAYDGEGGVGMCYEVISASEDELVLNYLPRGTRLRYLRKR
mgnify:CR=1 FL=1